MQTSSFFTWLSSAASKRSERRGEGEREGEREREMMMIMMMLDRKYSIAGKLRKCTGGDDEWMRMC